MGVKGRMEEKESRNEDRRGLESWIRWLGEMKE